MKFQKDIFQISFLFVTAIALGFLVTALDFSDSSKQAQAVVVVGVAEVLVEIADSSKERFQGLSGRDGLGKNEGMLFAFEHPGMYAFTMRGMKFPLDFIFVNENKVVGTEKNIPPQHSGQIMADTDFDRVLEVNAGFVEKNDIQIGDSVELIL